MIYTLVADGPSDEVLIPVLTWSLKRRGVKSVNAQWVDFRRIPRQRNLEQRLRTAVDLFPCDVLFVHRDAEAQPADIRRREITEAVGHMSIRHIAVVPVRMTEAWLLADERAIRLAAGNPNGHEDLSLPDIGSLEGLTDPKRVLQEALTLACGLNSRRRSQFPVAQRVRRIADYIDDYSRLDALSAFRALQRDIRELSPPH